MSTFTNLAVKLDATNYFYSEIYKNKKLGIVFYLHIGRTCINISKNDFKRIMKENNLSFITSYGVVGNFTTKIYS